MNLFALGEAVAQEPGPPPSGVNVLVNFFPFILIFVVFYFLLILPQQKRAKKRKAMLEALKKGDKVVTNGGIFGTITNLNKDTVTLQVGESMRIKLLRSAIEDLRSAED